MKIFVSNDKSRGRISNHEYNWCKPNEIVIFNLYHSDDSISMIGINSCACATNFVVKDLDISRDVYKDIVSDFVQKSIACKINRYSWDIEDKTYAKFNNIDSLVDKLLSEADKFDDYEYVVCNGFNINKRNKL